MQFVLMCWRLKGKVEKVFSPCCADSWLENVQSHQKSSTQVIILVLKARYLPGIKYTWTGNAQQWGWYYRGN